MPKAGAAQISDLIGQRTDFFDARPQFYIEILLLDIQNLNHILQGYRICPERRRFDFLHAALHSSYSARIGQMD